MQAVRTLPFPALLLVALSVLPAGGCARPGKGDASPMALPSRDSPEPAADRILATYYFYRYDWQTGLHTTYEGGRDALALHPQTPEELSYGSVDWHAKELRDMSAAGVNVVLPVYWGCPRRVWDRGDWAFDWSYKGIPPLVRALERLEQEGVACPRVGMMYDTASLRGQAAYPQVDLTTDEGKAWLYETVRDYYRMIPRRHWAFYRGRPVVLFYVSRWWMGTDRETKLRYTQDSFDSLRRRFRHDFGVSPYLIPDISWKVDVDSSYMWGAAISGFARNGVVGIGPGYDHSSVPGRTPRVAERQQGYFYERNWQRALACIPTFILVETWNEFHEASAICETREFGRLYIDLTRKYADRFFGGTPPTAPAGPYNDVQSARVVFGPEGIQEQGLVHTQREDGLTEQAEAGGRSCRATVPNEWGAQMMYFQVDDSFAFGPGPWDYQLTVAYFDGIGTFGVHYDADREPHERKAGPYSLAGEPIVMGETATWQTARFLLRDPLFLNRQFNDGDLRLFYIRGEDRLYVRSLQLERVPREAVPGAAPSPPPPVADYRDRQSVSVVLGPENRTDGLVQFDHEDGPTEAAGVGEQVCRKTMRRRSPQQYLYVRVDDGFACGVKPSSAAVFTVEVEYYDVTGAMRLEYDGLDTVFQDPDGTYRCRSGTYAPTHEISFEDSERWRTARFVLSDAFLGNRLNGGADFRLRYTGNEALYVRRITLVRTSSGTRPKEETVTDSRHGNAGNPMAVIDEFEMKQYINSFCVTGRGTWIISVTSGQIGDGKVYVRRSEDQGRTWSAARIPVYNPDTDPTLEGRAVYDAEMGQLFPVPEVGQGGCERIYQFSIVRNTEEGVRFGKLVYTYSEDDGRTWQGPGGANTVFDLESPVYDLVGHNWGWHLMAPPRQMSNGMVYLPMNASTDPERLADIRCEPVFARSRNLLTERDPAKIAFEFHPPPPHGVFVPLAGSPGESHGMEAQIVELSDGRFLSVIRTGNGCVYFVTSADQGDTWSEAKPLRYHDGGARVLNPNCPCPLTKLSDGRFALLHCNNDGGSAGGVFAAGRVRSPIYVTVGEEAPADSEQPVRWGPSQLMTTLQEYVSVFGSTANDLSYGLLHEENGRYYHFYNPRWERIQVNEIPAAFFE